MSLREKLRRFRQMGGPELKFRFGQRWRIQREQWGAGAPAGAADWPNAWNAEAVPQALLRERLQAGEFSTAVEMLPGYFARRGKPHFFFDPQQREALRAAHVNAFPTRLAALRKEADASCEHRFQVFGYPEVSVGPRIPWRRDMVHGTQAPAVHWARVPYLDFAEVGDSKVVWEPNRHQHFVTLGQTFFLTGDERYAEECLLQWDDWLCENPCGTGINWASSLELAFRVWSWMWAWHFLQSSKALAGARLAAITKSIAEHGDFIEQNLSTYFSPNTHLLGEGFALFTVGLLFPELKGADRWAAKGRRVLLEEMERQVRPDGWHIEQSSYYHRYAAEFFLCAAILGERNDCSFPSSFTAKLARMCEVILFTRLPSGMLPMLGDADGGRLLPFSAKPQPHESHDPRGVLSTAAVYFGRPDFRFSVARLHEDTFWLLGLESPGRFLSLSPSEPGGQSLAYGDAGCVVMRDGWGETSRMLLFDAGPQGLAGCAHGHADALSFVCSADGVDWLVDPGTYVYTSSPEWRAAFKGTRAHNTVTVDGADQAEPVDIFKWREIPQARLEKWQTSPSLDLAVASHTGYLRLPQGVLHRRRIIFVKHRYWLITDELKGTGEHSAEFLFHFAPGIRLTPEAGGYVASVDGKRFLIRSSEPSVEWTVIAGDEPGRTGWYSAEYGMKVPAALLAMKRRFTDSVCVHWLLFPNPQEPDYDVKGTFEEVTVRAGTTVDTLCQNPGAKRGGPGVSSDAELVLRSTSPPHGAKMALFNGCCIFVDGVQVLEAESMMDSFEAVSQGGVLTVQAQPLRRFRYRDGAARNVALNGADVAFSRKGDWIEVAPSR